MNANKIIFSFVSSLISSMIFFFVFMGVSRVLWKIFEPIGIYVWGGDKSDIIWGIFFGVSIGAIIGIMLFQKLFYKENNLQWLHAVSALIINMACMAMFFLFILDISGNFMFLTPVVASTISCIIMLSRPTVRSR